MFSSYDIKEDKHTLIFIAGFHLGIPLAICKTKKSIGWEEIREELKESFRVRSSLFKVVSVNYETETSFPLGKPLTIQYLNFFKVVNLPEYFQKPRFSSSNHQYELDNLIWVCPSGVVLVMARISFDMTGLISLDEFEETIEQHYSELTYIFTEVAEPIYEIFPTKLLNSSFCCKKDIEKSKEGIYYRKDFSNSVQNEYPSSLLLDNHKVHKHYEAILKDVYYIEFIAKKNPDKIRISYVDTSIESYDNSYLVYIGIAYSSFVGLLWLQEHLGVQTRNLQQSLISNSPLMEEISDELKLFRIFYMLFINESSPIRIRLTHKYMKCLEKCWEEYRMNMLVNQINSQLATLEKMFIRVEDSKKEVRNFKIGIAAILLALISISAVVAQLVSTIDVNSQLGVKERIFLILIGFIIGILSTVGIYILPDRKWSRRLRANKKKRQVKREQK